MSFIRSLSRSSGLRSFSTSRTIFDASQAQAVSAGKEAASGANVSQSVQDVVPKQSAGALAHDRATSGEIAAEVLSGAPNALLHRSVRIYQPTKSTMQSAKGKTKRWVLDWDVLPGSGRWENPLMGWASSADYMQGTSLFFKTQEDAVAFAEKQGWSYYIQTPKKAKIPPKNYASNYVHVPGKLRIHHTK